MKKDSVSCQQCRCICIAGPVVFHRGARIGGRGGEEEREEGGRKKEEGGGMGCASFPCVHVNTVTKVVRKYKDRA